jgi:hypothetical protein
MRSGRTGVAIMLALAQRRSTRAQNEPLTAEGDGDIPEEA